MKTKITRFPALRLAVAAMLATSTLIAQLSAAGTIYDLALDFSTNANPAGVWSYGYETNLGGAFVLYTDHYNSGAYVLWYSPSVYDPSGYHVPLVGSDTTNAYFHPGYAGQYSLFRLTAPAAGVYALNSMFTNGLGNSTGATTDVHVLTNDAAIFNGAVNGVGSGTNFAASLILSAGDRVDFAIGYGSDGAFNSDTTSLDARISLMGAGNIQLVLPSRIGTNFTFAFQTVTNVSYTVEYNDDLATTNWQFLEGMAGDGSLAQCLIPMTNATQRFFRARQALADSVAEFAGTQGYGGWYYGYYDGTSSTPYTTGDFKLMTNYDGVSWWRDNAPDGWWTAVFADGALPNGLNVGRTQQINWAVRRWISPFSGVVEVSGTLADLDPRTPSNGVIGHIILDGTEIWAQNIGNGGGTSYDLHVTVNAGSTLDFAVDPNGDGSYDSTKFTATIVH